VIPVDEYQKIVEQIPIVCVDAVIMNRKGQYLLVRRKNEPLKGEFWLPGGRIITYHLADRGN
jgi:colanic acid biosynthesis protein WcaH